MNFRGSVSILRCSVSAAVAVSSAQLLSADDYWDTDFGNLGVAQETGGVGALEWLGNKLVVGGSFAQIGGVTATNVAVWQDGRWSSVDDGIGIYDPQRAGVSAVKVIRAIDNEIYAAGYFTNAASIPRSFE